VENLDEILRVEGLDAILIGPYDLSASMGCTAQFDHPLFIAAMERIRGLCSQASKACGVHVVMPDSDLLKLRIKDGYLFLAYSIDAVMLNSVVSYGTH